LLQPGSENLQFQFDRLAGKLIKWVSNFIEQSGAYSLEFNARNSLLNCQFIQT
jgi:hypothetical protein